MKTIEVPLPSGDTVFCDDIRHEIHGKASLIGVYNGLLMVGELPALLPKLCCFVTLRQDPSVVDDVTFKIIWEPNDGEESVVAETTAQHDKIPHADVNGDRSHGPLISLLKTYFEISPFAFQSPGRLKCRAYVADTEIKLGSLVMMRADPPPAN